MITDSHDPAADDEPGEYLYLLMRNRAAEPLSEAKKARIQDLGHDMRIMLTTNTAEELVGLLNSHPRADGQPGGCGGSVTFDVPAAEGISGPRWTLHSLHPLHIEPSVLCRTCGHHGFIRDGQWVPA